MRSSPRGRGAAPPRRIRRPAESAPAPLPGLSTSASPPPDPRGGSGPGGTMFTSTGSSGLCKYRPPPSWVPPTRYSGHLLEAGVAAILAFAGGWGDGPSSQLAPQLGRSCPWGPGLHPHLSPEGRVGTASRHRPGPHPSPRCGAQQLSGCCRWAGQLGSGWVPRCSRGRAPCPWRRGCQAESRGCPGGGGAGSLPPFTVTFPIHLGYSGTHGFAPTCRIQPPFQEPIPQFT